MKRHSIELSSTVGKVRCLFKVADNVKNMKCTGLKAVSYPDT